MEPEGTPKPKNRLNFSVNLGWVVIALMVVIAAMLLMWKPWAGAAGGDRTIQVSGEATVKAEPDEYVFYPNYEFKNANKDTALAALSKKSDQIVAAVKKLGVPDSGIKTNASGYREGVYFPEKTTGETVYTLSLTITVSSRELAQKVQDYLVGTAPTGAVSPQLSFSQTKRKQLESQARDQAAKDARAKAEQMAGNVGFKLGAVKSISEGNGFGIPIPIAEDRAVNSKDAQLGIQPGQNELRYSVTVVYFIR